MRSICFLLTGLLLTVLGCDNDRKPAAESQPAAEKPAPDFDEEMLREAGVGTDNDSLLAFLRKRSASDADLLGLERLVRQLGSTDFNERQLASKKLVDLGLIALPLLRQAAKEGGLEMARRARACIEAIERDAQMNLPLGAVRLLARRNPPGAVEALLRYLPFVVDEDVKEEIWYGLDAIGVRAGKAHPALMPALTDAMPARRAVAGCILARVGTAEQRGEVKKLLTDKDPMVRLRAAQGFLAGKEKEREALRVLVNLLDQPSVHISWQAEELLSWVAGEQKPTLTVGSGSPEQRNKCRTAWADWWNTIGSGLELSKLGQGHQRPGLLLVADRAFAPERARVWLCGCDGMPRWQLLGLAKPLDVQLLPGNQVLITDANANCVTARSLDGNTVWEKRINGPLMGHRIPNGNTFISTGLGITEVAPDGTEIDLPNYTASAAQCLLKLKSGRLLINLLAEPSLLELNPYTGRRSRSIKLEEDLIDQCHVAELGTGHFLVVATRLGKVLELDGSGRIVWQHSVPYVTGATHLYNGNTLLEVNANVSRIIEIDNAGKVRWEAFAEGELLTFRICLGLVRFGFCDDRPSSLNLDCLAYRISALKGDNILARRHAAFALKELGPSDKRAIPALIGSLADSDQELQSGVRGALVAAGPAALQGLLAASKSENSHVRSGVIRILAELRGEATIIVPIISHALQDSDLVVRRDAAWALGWIGPGAKSAIPALIRALDDQDEEVSSGARTALARICKER